VSCRLCFKKEHDTGKQRLDCVKRMTGSQVIHSYLQGDEHLLVEAESFIVKIDRVILFGPSFCCATFLWSRRKNAG
jgi:hypothetical protein